MPNPQPSCFGKHWSATAPECRGGNDPSYVNPKDNGNRRDSCRWYGQCATQTGANKMQNHTQPQGVIPPQALTQHRSPPVPPKSVQFQQPAAAHAQALMPQPVQTQQPVMAAVGGQYVQPMYAAQPQAVPMNQPMLGASTQNFLMVPEPSDPGTSHAQRMTRTVFRSMFKAVALAVANYMDYYPVGPHPEE